MKTNRLSKLVTATAGLAAFALTVGADTAPKDDAVIRPPSVAVISIKVTNPAPRSTDAFLPVASAVPTSVVARWGNLKDCDFSQRARLFADLGRLEAMVDEQIGQLQVQRDAIKNSIDPMAWEFAMQELVNARSFLKASAQELRASTPEMWSRLKEKVSLGLTRTQNACDRVRSSSTSA